MSRINHFRANVEIQLARRGWKAADLARALDMTHANLRSILTKGHPKEGTIERFAEVLECSVDDLIKLASPSEYGEALIPRR